ncbi:putative hydrolase of the HAD superfamily [Paenibacillus taihuensis]|uniref:Putative hydrolase of the HAD superfamily n=1 Tax=Paenibacillus taihuensis TaxID=1156355 RepID=A0A3D9S6X1_9BACL|nr:HAD-IA family hydrolase [Paenibacillus taihuensis]REE88930.1 putative hydrolase of the HAD superfamily [Paenibacillus taihuensis]
MKKYSLLLFDLDDTLLDNASWFNIGLARTLEIHPATSTVDPLIFLEQVLQPPKSILESFIRREMSPDAFKKARWKNALSHSDIAFDEALIEEIDALFIETSMKYISTNESITSLLIDLLKNYNVAIVTNGLYDPRVKIQQMGLTEIFCNETIFHAERLGFRKPDPQLYEIALNHFGKAPTETLFIGDSWTHDVVGPMNAGMDAIWVNPKGKPQPTDHTPIAIVSDVTEIRRILLLEEEK